MLKQRKNNKKTKIKTYNLFFISGYKNNTFIIASNIGITNQIL